MGRLRRGAVLAMSVLVALAGSVIARAGTPDRTDKTLHGVGKSAAGWKKGASFGPGTSTALQLAASAGQGGFSKADLLAPGGIRMGMPVRKAKAALVSQGYRLRKVGGCGFELKGSSYKGYTRIGLNIRWVVTNTRFQTSGIPVIPRARTRCPGEEGWMVVGVSYKQYGDQAPKPVEPDAELQRVIRQIGMYNYCQLKRPWSVICTWRNVASDPTISQLRIKISNSGYRFIDITGNLREILPVATARKKNVRNVEMQALNICKNYGKGLRGGADTFRSLVDCRCIARKMGQAYSKGLIGQPSPSNLAKYRRDCPGTREKSSAYFKGQCLARYQTSAKAEERAWVLNGGCTCAGQKAADKHITDPITTYYGLADVVRRSAVACKLPGG